MPHIETQSEWTCMAGRSDFVRNADCVDRTGRGDFPHSNENRIPN
ncbi:MAG: hypothetical protein V8S31_11710 [Lachnospiraceae bacterium]